MVVRQQLKGEVGKFTIFLCQVSSGCPTQKIINISCFFHGLFKNKKGG